MMRFGIAVLFWAAIAVPMAAAAQYAQTQGQTLAGLERVRVLLFEPNERMERSELAELYTSATLELRKVGIRVAGEQDEIDLDHDGLLNISLIAAGGFSQAVSIRVDIEQRATLVRTGATLQMVTWYYEESIPNGYTSESATTLLTNAVNSLLSDWLDANGR